MKISATLPLHLRTLMVSLLLLAHTLTHGQTLGEALSATNLAWSTGGQPSWFVQTNQTHDGISAAGCTTNSFPAQGWLQTTVTGVSAITFSWKLHTCETYGSTASFWIGNQCLATLKGAVDWQKRSFLVPAGVQTLKWTYASASGSSICTSWPDGAWLDEVSLGEPVPPQILTQPTNQVVLAGDTANLAWAFSGSEPYSFRWLKYGTNLPNATNSTLIFTNVQASNAGDYSIVFTNPLGAVTSQVATLTVAPSIPVFTLQPLSQGASRGGTVTFQASAKGTEPLSWQWYVNGSPIAGATRSSYSVVNAQDSRFGNYWAVVTNTQGSVSSMPATLVLSPVIVWGNNVYGQTNVPITATNVTGLAAGDFHNLALRADGTVVAWGTGCWTPAYGGSANCVEYYGQTNVPPEATNVVGIAAGSAHGLALRDDGTVLSWGHILGGSDDLPAQATNVVALALGPGAQHALALRADGTVVDWGFLRGDTGTPPFTATNVVSVAAGAHHSLALRADGTVVAWGDSSYNATNVPASATNVIAIAAGWYNNLALRADGTLVQWGYSIGVPLATATNLVSIACGGNHALALRADGKIFAWGNNDYGQLVVPPWATNVVALAGSSYDSLALVGSGPPALTAAIVNRSVLAGNTVFFRAAAVGALPLYYQWQLNGTNLPGATNALLVLSNAQGGQAGTYSVTVSNALGVVTSPGTTLAVLPRQARILADSIGILSDQFGFTASSPAGLRWRVQSSGDLITWTDMNVLTNSIGTINYRESATNAQPRFYRLRLEP